MKTVVYSCNYQNKSNTAIIRAEVNDSTIDQDRNSGEFVMLNDNRKLDIFFRLRNPLGGETYKIETETEFQNNEELKYWGGQNVSNLPSTYTSNQSSCVLPVANCYQYRIRVTCTVTFPPIAHFDAPKDTVMTTFAAYCRKDPELVLTFECGETSVSSVKNIMMWRSDVIEAMMNSDCIEARTRNVKIVDFPASIVQKLVEFCESNHIKETKGDEMELCKIADKYNIELMRKFVTNSMNEVNVIELFQFAQTYNNTDLEQACVAFARRDKPKIFDQADVSKVDGNVLKLFWMTVNKTAGGNK